MQQLKRFVRFYRPHRKLFVIDMASATLRSAFMIYIPWISRDILGHWLKENNGTMIVICSFASLMLVVGMSITTYINTRWGHVLGTRIETDMRYDLFCHLQKLSFSYFDNTKTGHIMSRISNDLFNISEISHHAPEDLFISAITFVGASIFMLMIAPVMPLVAIIPIPIMLGWGGLIGSRLRNSFLKVRRTIADINSNVENAIQGIREVKSYANETHQLEQFSEVNNRFKDAKEDMYSKMAYFHSGMGFLTQSYKIIIILAGAFRCSYGKIDIVDVTAFLLYAAFIMDPIRRIVHFIETYQQGIASFQRFTEIMDVSPDIQDRPNPVSISKINGEIRFKNISFRYNNEQEMILKNISLSVPAGSTVALVGESGAGKSTLASLIPRFYEASEGEILLDDINVLDLKQSILRESVGIVQQTPFMFDASIRDNIMFGRTDASEHEIVKAARQANILDFIQSLPDGFESLVGEHGVKLSGGQKQRIAIARVFLKNPPVLIFDEATSSLDNESEQLIQSAMERLCENRTTIIIAHRLSTVNKADYTYVLRNGEIIEEGPHKELIDEQGYYYQLYTTGAVVV